ncbi:MAG: hypothetical protein ACREIV_14965 [Planctomycetaceae bacterium]
MGDLVLIGVLVVAYLFVFASCVSAFLAERRPEADELVTLPVAEARPAERDSRKTRAPSLRQRVRRRVIRIGKPEPALSR